MFSFVIILLLVGFLIYISRIGRAPQETTQDLLGGNHVVVYPNGIVKSSTIYKMIIEVQLFNDSTASTAEKRTVWSNFFLFLNTLATPSTLLVQSQYLELKDYTSWYAKGLENDDFPNQLKIAGEQVVKHLEETFEESKVTDHRGFVFLTYDPVASSVESGVETGVAMLDNLFKSKKDKMTKDEEYKLSEQILEEIAEEVYNFCDMANMRYQRLNREGVYNVDYAALQRELSANARMVDAIDADSFHYKKTSWEEA